MIFYEALYSPTLFCEDQHEEAIRQLMAKAMYPLKEETGAGVPEVNQQLRHRRLCPRDLQVGVDEAIHGS